MINPNSNVKNANYNFTFVMSGTQYSWWEKLIAGPNGTTYFWIGIGCGGAIVLILIAVVIWLIVRCCRGRAQVQDEGARDDATSYNSGKNPDERRSLRGEGPGRSNSNLGRNGVQDPGKSNS